MRKFLLCFCILAHTLCIKAQTTLCNDFQNTIGSNANERVYDVVPSLNGEFFSVGLISNNGGNDILVTKLNSLGQPLWTKAWGGAGEEIVRKASATADGGVLITGQTRSYGNPNGDILCLKVSANGTLAWQKKFGAGSANGDLGMDIVETTDGGYAVVGIINVIGTYSDAVVIKLDASANITWTKRFDHSDGDDGVGILQKGDSLIVSIDLQNYSAGNYAFTLNKLKMSTGAIYSSTLFVPDSRGLFNPYIMHDPAGSGYIVSGHTIDGTSYANMKHTVIAVDQNFVLKNTRLLSISPLTNDYFTGIVPLADGSFIGAASPLSSPKGVIYKINADNTVAFSKRLNTTGENKFYRLTRFQNKIIASGGINTGSNEDQLLFSFNESGTSSADCNVQNIGITVSSPTYAVSPYSWPNVSSVTFGNTVLSLSERVPGMVVKTLCPQVDVDFDVVQDTCKPHTVRFIGRVTPPTSFSWNFGNGVTNTVDLNPQIVYAASGIYDVKLKSTAASGCVDSAFKQIVINDKLPITASVFFQNICEGDSLKFYASGGNKFSWQPAGFFNNPALSSPTAMIENANVYSVIISDTSCQTDTTINIPLAVRPTPKVSFNIDQDTCRPSVVNFTGFINPPSGFTWNFGNGTTNTTETSPEIIYNTPGTYAVNLIAVNSQGCKDSAEKQVTIIDKVHFSASVNAQNICEGDSLNFQAYGGNKYSWQPAGFFNNPVVSSPTAMIENANVYSVIISDTICRTDTTINIPVAVRPTPKVSFDVAQDTCKPSVVNFTGFINPPSGFTWNFGNGTTNTTETSPEIIYNAPGTYAVNLIAVNSQGCKDSVEKQITIINKVNFSGSVIAENICEGDSLTFHAYGGNKYSWQPAIYFNNPAISAPTASIANLVNYSVTISDTGCAKDTLINFPVVANPKPRVDLVKSNNISCSEPYALLVASGAMEYSWFPLTNIVDRESNSIKVSGTQTNEYIVTGKNQYGCEDTAAVTVEFRNDGMQKIHVPSAFTPNGDGKNDCIRVKSIAGARFFELSIFNRWGERVFFTNNVNDCWNGIYNGKLQPSGVFVYLLKAEGECGGGFRKGIITLIN